MPNKQNLELTWIRNGGRDKGWVQFVHTLAVPTEGGPQTMLCANTEGLFRIIQSIPSPKAEPFKRWLAKVGYERVQEIEDPERRPRWRHGGRKRPARARKEKRAQSKLPLLDPVSEESESAG